MGKLCIGVIFISVRLVLCIFIRAHLVALIIGELSQHNCHAVYTQSLMVDPIPIVHWHGTNVSYVAALLPTTGDMEIHSLLQKANLPGEGSRM